MMDPSILHRLFKIFNMKIYFTIVGFLIVYFLNAQAVLPHALLINNNAYPSTITANTSFNFESAVSGLPANTYPAIKSDFSFNFTDETPYTIQFWVTKLVQKTASRGFIGFTTATDGLSYSTGSFLFYEFSGDVLRNYVKNSYHNDNIPLAGFAIGRSYQITTTYDGLSWRNYINGELVTTARNTIPFNATANLMLGNIGGYTNVVFDEVRFWDKALTANEINGNWRKPIEGSESGLKLYYNFNNQGYATENNATIKFLKDQTANNYKGTFLNLSLLSTKNNFVNDVNQINSNDGVIATFDANSLDSYPGNGHGFNGNSDLCPTCWIDLTPNVGSNFVFFNSSNYTINAAPILSADGGRSLLINNIYGKTTTASGISGSASRSFEAWVKFNTLNNNSVVSIGNLANADLFEMAVNNNKLILSSGTDLAMGYNIKSISSLNTNTWYHIVITYKPPSVVNDDLFYTIYINGIFENNYYNAVVSGQSAIAPTINTTNTNIYIGNRLRPFNGKLGILKIYNIELNATEVLNKYNATKSRYGY